MITKQKKVKEVKETEKKPKIVVKNPATAEKVAVKKATTTKVVKKTSTLKEKALKKEPVSEASTPKKVSKTSKTTKPPVKKEIKEKNTAKSTLANILKLMDKMDIKDIISIDVRDKTSICDTFIIGSIIANRQAKSLVEALRAEYKADGVFRVEGLNTDWIIVDMGEIIIHILTSDARDYYKLEEIWQ